MHLMASSVTHVGSSRSRRLPDCFSTCSTTCDSRQASTVKQLAVVVARPQTAAGCPCSVVNDRNLPPHHRQKPGTRCHKLSGLSDRR